MSQHTNDEVTMCLSRKCERRSFWVEVSAEKEVRDRSAAVRSRSQTYGRTAGAVAEARPPELPRLGAGCSEGAPRGGSSKEGGCQGDDARRQQQQFAAAAVTTAAAASSAASSAIPREEEVATGNYWLPPPHAIPASSASHAFASRL
eukprot:scaffold59361_cov98-Phaeocystis_antarctica.AAC.4